MATRYSCPECGERLRFDEAPSATRTRCPACRAVVAVPPPIPEPAVVVAEVVVEEPVPPKRERKTIRVHGICAVLSAVWLALLCLTPLRATFGGLLVTAGFIGVNLVVSLYTLFTRHHILLLLNGLQLGLFGFVNYQVFAALGPEHFTYDTEPKTWD